MASVSATLRLLKVTAGDRSARVLAEIRRDRAADLLDVWVRFTPPEIGEPAVPRADSFALLFTFRDSREGDESLYGLHAISTALAEQFAKTQAGISLDTLIGEQEANGKEVIMPDLPYAH